MSYKVNFIGRLGNDAEIIENGNAKFISCRVAVDESVNKEKTTRWVSLSLDANRFKNVSQYLKKGKPVFVTGSERVSVYTTKNGEHAIDTRVFVDSIEFVGIGQKPNEQQNTTSNDQQHNNEKETAQKEIELPIATNNSDDELPF